MNNSKPTPIFIIGTQRSGSNLLRLMLNESPDIAAPHPPHILKVFFPLLKFYGDLAEEANFDRLIQDVCEFVQKNPVEWEVLPTFEKIKPKCSTHTLIEVMCAVYELTAEAKGAAYWCCKSMANVEFLPELQAALPQAKYIYLYRDGRDVALSFSKAIVGEKHFYSIAKQWANDQGLALRFKETCSADRFFMLQYEYFIDEPETELKRLCDFLSIEYQSSMMQYYQSKESKRTAESGDMWKNVLKPVLTNNKKKFLQECSPEQIAVFESVARDYLDGLGYYLVSDPKDLKEYSEAEIAEFEAENARLKQAIRHKISPEELNKRAGQEALIRRIKGE